VRDKIKLEEQAAKKSVIEGIDGLGDARIGVIEIPAFYRDFRGASKGDKDFRSTTRDVRRLLAELEADGVSGVVVDLRNNGGGSLTEATELTGLFIREGPVVQIRDHRGGVDLEKDTDPELVYEGPLAVLVNRNSASASEIFAGAIQDYGRGIIVGEPTFGKGTVQQLVELGDYLSGRQDIGRLRMTIAQFFRVNGASTQHKGVVPDIVYPTVGDVDYGERSLDNALPWDTIKPAAYQAFETTMTDTVSTNHKARIAKDPGFRFLTEEAAIVERLQDQRIVSLNKTRRVAEREQRENERLALRNIYRKSIGLPPLSRAQVEDDDDEVLTERREEERLAEVQLNETARILADSIRLGGQPVIRAAQVAPSAADVLPDLR
jgi:carboxyl-terminal processing protease